MLLLRFLRTHSCCAHPLTLQAAAVYNGGLYAVGGYDGSSDSNTVDRYDGDSWVTVAPMQNRRSTCGAVTFNDCLYVIGGCDGVDASETRHRTVEKWNGVRWCESEPMHECRSGVCCTVFNGHIYALGGRNMNNSILRTVERLVFSFPAVNLGVSTFTCATVP